MEQDIVLAALLALLALVLFRVFSAWQNDGSRTRKTGTRSGGSDQPYHCVTLAGDCECLNSYRGKRFLAGNAPPLPVPDCSVARCHCHYVHHADRRQPAGDRRSAGRMSAERFNMSGSEERRHSLGRRKSDSKWALADQWTSAV